MNDDMESRLIARLEAIETRLMVRINDGQERVLERLGGVEKRLDGVDLTLRALTELARASNTLLLDLTRRVTDLEKKG